MNESSILELKKANRGLTQRSGSEDMHDVHHTEVWAIPQMVIARGSRLIKS